MATIYLIEGPVGAGKTTFSRELSEKISAPHINLDTWMARLFQADRPATGSIGWYLERKERCIEQIWDVAIRSLNANCDMILELGLIQRNNRQAMYQRIAASGHKLVVYVLDAPREERRERVKLRNFQRSDSFSMEVSDEVFEIASNMWEEPDDIECTEQEIIFMP